MICWLPRWFDHQLLGHPDPSRPPASGSTTSTSTTETQAAGEGLRTGSGAWIRGRMGPLSKGYPAIERSLELQPCNGGISDQWNDQAIVMIMNLILVINDQVDLLTWPDSFWLFSEMIWLSSRCLSYGFTVVICPNDLLRAMDVWIEQQQSQSVICDDQNCDDLNSIDTPTVTHVP